jgi:hypothetical protein
MRVNVDYIAIIDWSHSWYTDVPHWRAVSMVFDHGLRE